MQVVAGIGTHCTWVDVGMKEILHFSADGRLLNLMCAGCVQWRDS